MVKISKIYTRTGDDGSTGLVDGSRISKDSLKVNTYGEIDELNAWIGLIRTLLVEEKDTALSNQFETIQNILFDIGAVLASPPDYDWNTKRQINTEDISFLEDWIDEITSAIPELRSFVLPGGTKLNSYFHLARTVCRRAERSCVALQKVEPVQLGILQFLNRLSDLLFAISRLDIIKKGEAEFLWSPCSNKPIKPNHL